MPEADVLNSPRRRSTDTWVRQLVAALVCGMVGLLVRQVGGALPSPVAAVGLGVGVVGAAFLLAWAAQVAELELPRGIVLALLAFVVVLPELLIEVHFGYTQQDAYATANLGGATRLLLTVAVAMPLLGAWLLRSGHGRAVGSIRLNDSYRLELGVLSIAAVGGLFIARRGKIGVVDGVLLGGLYLVYLSRVRSKPREPDELFGVARGLAERPAGERRLLVWSLLAVATVVVVSAADPFAEAVLHTGTLLGISPVRLVQSIVPIVSEAPELVIAFVLVVNRRPAQGIAILVAATVSQWTIGLAGVAIAHAAGGGGALVLEPAQQVELAFTGATTLMAVAAFATLAPSIEDAWIMLVVFAQQMIAPGVVSTALVAFALGLVAVDLLIHRRRAIGPLLGAVFSGAPAGATPERRRP